MTRNQKQFKVLKNQKILHKIKKNWFVISATLLGLVGTGAALTNVHASTNTASPVTQHVTNEGQNSVDDALQQPTDQRPVMTLSQFAAEHRNPAATNLTNRANSYASQYRLNRGASTTAPSASANQAQSLETASSADQPSLSQNANDLDEPTNATDPDPIFQSIQSAMNNMMDEEISIDNEINQEMNELTAETDQELDNVMSAANQAEQQFNSPAALTAPSNVQPQANPVPGNQNARPTFQFNVNRSNDQTSLNLVVNSNSDDVNESLTYSPDTNPQINGLVNRIQNDESQFHAGNDQNENLINDAEKTFNQIENQVDATEDFTWPDFDDELDDDFGDDFDDFGDFSF